MELDPQHYRDAAAHLSPGSGGYGAEGMCTALARHFQTLLGPVKYNPAWVEQSKEYGDALVEAFIGKDSIEAATAYWWTENMVLTETFQAERFMALHFMAEMLENPQ
jgi:hypothetical protein